MIIMVPHGGWAYYQYGLGVECKHVWLDDTAEI